MKSLFSIIILSFAAFFFINASCKKNQVINRCGCNTDSIVANFQNKDGILNFYSAQNQNDWFVTIEFPPYSQKYMCKICNPNLSSITAITDTMPKTNNLRVIFSGRITNLCPDESFGFQPANVSPFHITIDSLKKQ